ncbi:MAG: hypothetical protein IJP41_09750 [Synergistaceae bacterium]|nr:hypothetical protein [Synergistaceae bacterium]
MIEFRHVMDMERRILILRKKFSYLFLISFLGILTALPISADYVDQAEAPLSPEFLEWQRINSDNLQNDYRMFSDSGQNDFSAGYRPSPVNTSHLSENLPAAEIKNTRVRLRSAPCLRAMIYEL